MTQQGFMNDRVAEWLYEWSRRVHGRDDDEPQPQWSGREAA